MKNRIKAVRPREDMSDERMKEIEGEDLIASDFPDYLKDESRLSGGKARILAFPRSEAEISRFLETMNGGGTPVTVSGARTGITGGAVPLGGALLSLERMNRFLGLAKDPRSGEWRLRVQPGVLLEEIHRRVETKDMREMLSAGESGRASVEEFIASGKDYFYPVDPTEASASLGGTVATNASGERSFHYGPTRDYVRALRVVLANGDVLDLRRGEFTAGSGGECAIVLTSGETVPLRVPSYTMPRVKNAAGYYAREGMDPIDLFIGSEGTLGVISEVEIALRERPENILGLVAFFPSEKDAVKFFLAARDRIAGALVFEYFDSRVLGILREKKEREGAGSSIPALPGKARAGIFFEVEFAEEELDSLYETVEELLHRHNSSSDEAWGGMEEEERRKIRSFRHAIPEAVNEIVARNKRSCPAVHKVGTDMAVPAGALEEMIDYYYGALDRSGLSYAVFGHIGDNHLHVNMLPRTEEELGRAVEIGLDFARRAVALGGTVSAEHGIGKIKKSFLEILYGEAGLREMARLKKTLDPRGILNRGNIFPEDLL